MILFLIYLVFDYMKYTNEIGVKININIIQRSEFPSASGT